jgi:hypothetical protein
VIEELNILSRRMTKKGSKEPDVKFIISFLGSSVTAGKDHNINDSFPVVRPYVDEENTETILITEATLQVLRSLLGPVLQSVNIDLVTRNSALANNPCIPYDMCVQTFAGMNPLNCDDL